MTTREKLILAGLLVGTSILVRRALRHGWAASLDAPPPEQSRASFTFGEALAWSALTGTAVSLTRLMVRRRYLTGRFFR